MLQLGEETFHSVCSIVRKENPCLDLAPALRRRAFFFLAAGRHHGVELSQTHDVLLLGTVSLSRRI